MRRQGRADRKFLAEALRYHPRWLLTLRTGKHYGKLPSEFLGGNIDHELDYMLTMALEVHDLELLCVCGGYKSDCQDDDAAGWFEVDDDTICWRLAARQDHEKNAKDLEPGTLVKVVDTRVTAPIRD